jgi:hypothetical protein
MKGVAMSVAFLSSRSKQRARGSSHTAVRLLILSGTLALAAQPALATSSEVRFDAPFLVSCRDVTTDAFAASSPHQRLVEARFDITALPADDQSPQGLQYLYHFVSPTGTVQIVDYQPRTSQATQWAGNVSIERQQETGKSLGVSLSGGAQPLAQGAASADRTEKSTAQIRYELKPPMEVILVAGTVQRGTGVYFKLLPSAESAWEGSHEFVIVMRVSRDWRGDVMYLRCEAQQDQRGRVASRGVSRFVVGIHAAGDEEARLAAENLNHAEQALRRAVAERQKDIERRSMPTVVHRVGALLDMYDPRIPATWLDRLVYGSTDIEQYDFVDYLPDNVRRLADHYAQAKRCMYDYSGKRLASRRDGFELGAR